LVTIFDFKGGIDLRIELNSFFGLIEAIFGDNLFDLKGVAKFQTFTLGETGEKWNILFFLCDKRFRCLNFNKALRLAERQIIFLL
jgi:hypothetical protein